MRFCAVFVMMIASVPACRPQNLRFGGTFIGAVVVEDGVVIASDSRSTFTDAAGEAVGYIDGMGKVFVGRGGAFAVSGLTSVNGELFGSFIERNDFLLARPADEMLLGLSLWLPIQNSTNVLLISAGFLRDETRICAKGPIRPQTCQASGYIANRESASLRRWHEAQTRPPGAEEAAAALRQAIMESGSADPTVGGPVAILHLRRSGPPQWLENLPQPSGWKTVCDIVRDYRLGRAFIHASKSKAELDHHLSRACR